MLLWFVVTLMEILSASELDFSPSRTLPGPDFQWDEQFSRTPVVQIHHHVVVLVVRQHCMKEDQCRWGNAVGKHLILGKLATPSHPRPALFRKCKNVNLHALYTFSVCGSLFWTAATQDSRFAAVLPTGCCLWWLSSLLISQSTDNGY